ncbi:30S ribosomal protein S20 [bacterium B17]|nr:30S ribosomal protein S20 [bacterium B17]
MPNIKSAKKRMKTSAAKQELNKSVKSTISSQRRKLYEAIAAGDKSECEELFRAYGSSLDKAAKKGVIKANNASRRKSRAAARMASL